MERWHERDGVTRRLTPGNVAARFALLFNNFLAEPVGSGNMVRFAPAGASAR